MRAAIVEISGKLGREIALLDKTDDFFVVAGFDENNNIERAENADFDVIIEFARACATAKTLNFAKKHRVPVVIGTTGHDEEQRKEIENAAKSVPILYAANFSLGAYALEKAAQTAKNILKNAEITIVETHRKGKLDCPGGTAKELALSVGGAEIFSVRRGDVAGRHELIFDCGNQTLTLCHEVYSRRAFAEGAVLAAKKLISLPAGLYGADDVFGGKA